MLQKSQPYAWHVVRDPAHQKHKNTNRGVEIREGNFIKFGRMCFWIWEAKIEGDGIQGSHPIPSVPTKQDEEGENVVSDHEAEMEDPV